MFTVIVLMFATMTFAIPILIGIALQRYSTKKVIYKIIWWLPFVASLVFVVSFFLPDIHISSATSTFQQHLVGGGIYSACLYLYLKQLLNWRFNIITDLVMLFAWVSALGVANKILEFVAYKGGVLQLDMSDAYYDLIANTLGAYLGYVVIVGVTSLMSHVHRTKAI